MGGSSRGSPGGHIEAGYLSTLYRYGMTCWQWSHLIHGSAGTGSSPYRTRNRMAPCSLEHAGQPPGPETRAPRRARRRWRPDKDLRTSVVQPLSALHLKHQPSQRLGFGSCLGNCRLWYSKLSCEPHDLQWRSSSLIIRTCAWRILNAGAFCGADRDLARIERCAIWLSSFCICW